MKTPTQLAGWSCVLLALAACEVDPPIPPMDAGSGADVVAPRVLRTEPAHQATGVPIASAFLVQFSEPMNSALVTVTLSPASSLGVGTWNARKDQVTFNSAAPLQFNTFYTLEVTGQDLAGNALSSLGSSFFTEQQNVTDAGTDGGVPDAGQPPDAGPPPDGGLPGGGWDAIVWDVHTWQ